MRLVGICPCAALTSSTLAFTNSSTGVTKADRRAASSLARATLTKRGLLGYITKPMASAPAATAASTSLSRVRPQILMRVRCKELVKVTKSVLWQKVKEGGALGQPPFSVISGPEEVQA